MSPRLYIVAIGGPTCSGKTTLAKHLARILPNATSLFQDDFAPPAEQVPVHPVHGVQDWDDPDGAIDWPRQRETLQFLRSHDGEFPSAHYSHDSFNAQVPVPIADSTRDTWKSQFEEINKEGGEDVKYIIADGFLMLVDPESVKQFDVKILVREGYEVLKKRRDDRHGYHTAEGALWTDPPNYWDNIVWPAYLKAHRPLFVDGDVETGAINSNVISGVELLEASELTMDELVDRACRAIYGQVKSGKSAKDFERP